MITGTLTMVNNLNTAIQTAQMFPCKIVFIGELKQLPQGIIEYSILLPPVEALNAEVEGNIQQYNMIYNQYLMYTPYCQEAIATILAAISRGVNIVVCIEEGDNLSHGQFLWNFFKNTFGLIMATVNNPFQFNANYLPIINMILYYWYGESFTTLLEVIDYYGSGVDVLRASNLLGINLFEKIAELNNLHKDQQGMINWINEYKRRIALVRKSGFDKNGKPITSIIVWDSKPEEKKPETVKKEVSKKKTTKKGAKKK